MKTIDSYRSSARVTEEIEDTRAIAQQLANATHGNHLYLLDDNTYSYGVYLYKCNKCGYEY